MLLVPRDYQDFGINSVFDYFGSNDGNPLLLYPTGTGKSIIVAGICVRALAAYPGTRILMLTKTKELVKQNYDKLRLAWSDAPVGIYCDGLGKKQHHFPITFGSIASVQKQAALFGFIDFVIIDEAHEVSDSDTTMYRKFIAELKLRNPKIKTIGLTATGWRMKQGRLTQGANALFTDVCVDSTGLEAFNWFFDEGYLVPPVPKPTETQYDLSQVKISGGEYEQKSLMAEVDNDKKNEQAVLEMLEMSKDRHVKLVFASGVTHCKHIVDILKYYGQSATWVASVGMGDAERDRNIAAYQDNQFEWMVNNGILTTGFDKSDIDYIGMLRHTLSTGLWVQMLGRGTRPFYAPGFNLSTRDGRLAAISASVKHNCLVGDFAQNVTRLGCINDPRVPEPKERKRAGDAPVRICESCGCYNHASARSCWQCGFEFPRYLKINETASTKALVRKAPVFELPQVEEWKVDRVAFMVWKKPDKPDSIRVMYHCGSRMISEWVCLEHGGRATRIAKEWWNKRGGVPPETTEEAYKHIGALSQPKALQVIINKPMPEIHSHVF
jgi:DNA repair protein RadD